MVPWVLKKGKGTNDKPVTYHRYYHLYKNGELEHDIIAAGGEILQSGYDKDNWWSIARTLAWNITYNSHCPNCVTVRADSIICAFSMLQISPAILSLDSFGVWRQRHEEHVCSATPCHFSHMNILLYAKEALSIMLQGQPIVRTLRISSTDLQRKPIL